MQILKFSSLVAPNLAAEISQEKPMKLIDTYDNFIITSKIWFIKPG